MKLKFVIGRSLAHSKFRSLLATSIDPRSFATASLKSVLMLAMLAALTTACVPKTSPLTTAAASVSDGPKYAGFDGLTSAQTTGATKVKLNWDLASDPAVVGYNIYDTTLISAPKLIKTASASTGSVTITGLTTENYYSFRVRATTNFNSKIGIEDGNNNDLGAIPYGGIVSVNVTSSTAATVIYNDASNADTVQIFCHSNLNPIDELVAEVKNVLLTQTNLTGLTAGVPYTCRAALSIGGFVDNNTNTITFTPMGTAAQILFAVQPGSAQSGAALSTQPIVRILDANGTLVSAGPDSSATVTLIVAAASPSTGSVRGTSSVTAVGGIATFSGINMLESGSKILTAKKADTSSQTRGSGPLQVDSNAFVISPGNVSPLTSTISISPAGPLVADGTSAYTVTFVLKDANGNPVSGVKPTFGSTDSDTLVQPTNNSDNTGTTTGSVTTTVADSLRSLYINSPSGLSTISVLAPYIAGAATQLAFTTQPQNAGAGTPMGNVAVAIQDRYGNVVTTDSVSSVSMAIASNTGGATLTGTNPSTVAAGVATFGNLNINLIATGYKLLASSGTLTPAYSNTFNITAASAQKLAVFVTAPVTNTVVSNGCSGAITFQLQDSGNNKANALQSTPINITGLGGAALYASSSCSGTAQGAQITFTAGVSTKTFYLKDPKAEALTITASDPSAVLTTGTLAFVSTPDKIAISSAATTVVAGKCSAAITINAEGDNAVAGPNFAAATVTVSGVVGSSAVLYADALCTSPLVASAITYPVNTSAPYGLKVYLKDNKSENLSLNVSDNSGIMTAISSLQNISVLASNVIFTGPTSVVAGACSTAYTITLKDSAANAVSAPANTTLNINGLQSSTTGAFYTNSSCSGTAYNSTLTVPQGSSAIQVYFKDTSSESLNIFMSDPTAAMASSATIHIGISPSAFGITSAATTTKTTVCAGPFNLKTLDGSGNVTAAISGITANLTGAGAAGIYYSDPTCLTPVTSFLFSAGDSLKTFYYIGQYPGSFTFTATDAAATLTTATYTFAVTSAPGFIGTSAIANSAWFQTGVAPVAVRQNGVQSIGAIHMESTGKFLYVSDPSMHRVHKYDYLNHTYVGWIGMYSMDTGGTYNIANYTVQGSSLTTPSAASCISTTTGNPVPGWCLGGNSSYSNNLSTGSLRDPRGITDDGTYLYVTNQSGYNVSRYDLATGAFAGWIGRATSAPTSGAAGCTTTTGGNQTPGWCYGGTNAVTGYYGSNPYDGTGVMINPYAITNDGSYLYVAVQGAIMKFDMSGAYKGWIGFFGATHATGGASGCTTGASGTVTPGWCIGGTFMQANPKTSPGAVNDPRAVVVIGTTLYVLHNDNSGTITYYSTTSGAYLGRLASLSYNWSANSYGMTTDGTYLYVTDWSRVIRVDNTGTITGWIGKVGTPPTADGDTGVGGPTGCASLATNAVTANWCLGGAGRYGVEEGAFAYVNAIDYDPAGHLITGGSNFNAQSYTTMQIQNLSDQNPALKKWNITTGAYEGTLGAASAKLNTWSASTTDVAQYYGYDDTSMDQPSSSYNDGTYLYVAEYKGARIKKIDFKTGKTLGWIGGITTTPTGGATGCAGAVPMGPAPGWCLGALPNPHFMWNTVIPAATNGIMHNPVAITGDGTNLYVVDQDLHRVQKFKASDGSYLGWIGGVSSTPTGGAAGCTTKVSGQVTPGWCLGGYSQIGTGDGQLNWPSAITYVAGTGNIYVVDYSNQRVVSFNATSGAYNGWIGGVNAAPSGGCTTGANASGSTVSTGGWCTGGTAAAKGSCGAPDKGGGFAFGENRAGITTDGTYLFISNSGNNRIDKWSTGGVFQGGTYTRTDIYTSAWTTNATTLGVTWATCQPYVIRGIWTDGTSLFGTTRANTYTSWASNVFKMDLTSGAMIGWRGAILPTQSPTAGDTGCAGATGVTPGWCQGGVPNIGLTLGGFYGAVSVSGDTGATGFIYVNDENSGRVTRLPK